MELTQYIDWSERTEKKFPDGAHLPQAKMELLHAALGVAGEAAELIAALDDPRGVDWINVAEEIGDYVWFLAMLTRHLDLRVDEAELATEALSPARASSPPHMALAKALTRHAGEIVDTIKRWVIYQAELDRQRLEAEVLEAWYMATSAATVAGWSLDSITDTNIAKLWEKRYPDGYNDVQANLRDLRSERDTLESSLR